jgi:PTH1 family peptidyl-tRNA hydrolase
LFDTVLIAGLGNPGFKYEKTRHNFGFMVVDEVARRLKIPMWKGEGPYQIGQGIYQNRTVILIKPMTYMNRSGIAVDDAIKRYQIPMDRLLVLCDDFHLSLGQIRLRPRGSDGGHNGLASIINYLRTDRFSRLRLGIGQPAQGTIDFVLSDFTNEEKDTVNQIKIRAGNAALDFMEKGIDFTMSHFNSFY